MRNIIFKHIGLILIVSLTSILGGKAQKIPAEQIHVHLQKNMYKKSKCTLLGVTLKIQKKCSKNPIATFCG